MGIPKAFMPAVTLAAALALAGCGGGGGGGGVDASPGVSVPEREAPETGSPPGQGDVPPGGPVSQPPEAEVAEPPETEPLPNREENPDGRPEINSPTVIFDPIPSFCDRFPSLSQCQEDDTIPGDAAETVNLSGPATLADHGSYRRTGTATYSQTSTSVCVPGPCTNRFPGTFQGTRTAYGYSEWGFWARVGGATLFRADIRRSDDVFSPGNVRHVEGSRSGSRPTGGAAATWTGHVRAYEAHPDTYGTPVEGTARLSVDFGGSTLSADLTGFSRGHPDLSWSLVRIGPRGEFSQGPDRSTTPAISGAFYGAEHQGVAGRFSSATLDGVFGAAR